MTADEAREITRSADVQEACRAVYRKVIADIRKRAAQGFGSLPHCWLGDGEKSHGGARAALVVIWLRRDGYEVEDRPVGSRVIRWGEDRKPSGEDCEVGR